MDLLSVNPANSYPTLTSLDNVSPPEHIIDSGNDLSDMISINLLGSYISGGESMLAFALTAMQNYAINGTPKGVVSTDVTGKTVYTIEVTLEESSTLLETTKYYDAPTGYDFSIDNFSINFLVSYTSGSGSSKSTSTNTWVFTKGGVGEDDLKPKHRH